VACSAPKTRRALPCNSNRRRIRSGHPFPILVPPMPIRNFSTATQSTHSSHSFLSTHTHPAEPRVSPSCSREIAYIEHARHHLDRNHHPPRRRNCRPARRNAIPVDTLALAAAQALPIRSYILTVHANTDREVHLQCVPAQTPPPLSSPLSRPVPSRPPRSSRPFLATTHANARAIQNTC